LAVVEAMSSKMKKKRQMELTTSKPASGSGGQERWRGGGRERRVERGHTNSLRSSEETNVISK
jgi:hypothetical protein